MVDDDPETLRYVRAVLTDAGYAPVVRGDPEGLSRIIRAERPALVLLDLVLPGPDGIELMKRVPELSYLRSSSSPPTGATRPSPGRSRAVPPTTSSSRSPRPSSSPASRPRSGTGGNRRLAGSKLVVVLGHTSCGAVKGAISAARLGNLTQLVQKIDPAVEAIEGERDVDDAVYVDGVAEENVRMVIAEIRRDSSVLATMEQEGEIRIVGGMYDVSTGAVRFI